MTLNKEDKKTLAEYNWSLQIQSKTEKEVGTVMEMNGDGNLENVFLEIVLVELANDLRKGKEEFEKYKKQGTIVKDKDGNWNLNDQSAQGLAGQGVTVDNNEPPVSLKNESDIKMDGPVDMIKDKKDFKGGEIDDTTTSK